MKPITEDERDTLAQIYNYMTEGRQHTAMLRLRSHVDEAVAGALAMTAVDDARPTPMKPIYGVLTRAGTFPIRDLEETGFVVTCSPEELRAVPSLPMYEPVVIVTRAEFETLAQTGIPFVSGAVRVKIDVAGKDLLAVRRAAHALLDSMIESPNASGWAVGKSDCNGVATRAAK